MYLVSQHAGKKKRNWHLHHENNNTKTSREELTELDTPQPTRVPRRPRDIQEITFLLRLK